MNKWKEFDVYKKLVPKLEESDKQYLIVLNNKFVHIAYYYQDSSIHHFSSIENVYDHKYDGYVTHYMELPELPE